MRLVCSAAIALLIAPALARAQEPADPPPAAPPPQPAAPGPGEAPLDQILEQRVTERLAARGTPLSRLGVALDVQVMDQRAAVTLVDPQTHEVLAQAAIDAPPADRPLSPASDHVR